MIHIDSCQVKHCRWNPWRLYHPLAQLSALYFFPIFKSLVKCDSISATTRPFTLASLSIIYEISVSVRFVHADHQESVFQGIKYRYPEGPPCQIWKMNDSHLQQYHRYNAQQYRQQFRHHITLPVSPVYQNQDKQRQINGNDSPGNT